MDIAAGRNASRMRHGRWSYPGPGPATDRSDVYLYVYLTIDHWSSLGIVYLRFSASELTIDDGRSQRRAPLLSGG
jgi:hypothetical protein